MNFENYIVIYKCRSKNGNKGGGIALLIKNDILFEEMDIFDKLNIEIIAIKIKFSNTELIVVSYYNPPEVKLCSEVWEELEKNSLSYLVCGDLNARSQILGGQKTNKNGKVLEEILENSNAIVLNEKNKPTFFKSQNDQFYQEVLDYFICSSSIFQNSSKVKVHYKSEVHSDHHPISVSLIGELQTPYIRSVKQNYILKKANWTLFKSELETIVRNSDVENISKDFNRLSKFITNSIQNSADRAIPKNSGKVFSNKLPSSVLNLIKERKFLKKQIFKKGNIELKPKLNKLSKEIKSEIQKVRSEQWEKFLEKCGRNKTSSIPFWRKINQVRSKKQKQKSYPNFIYNNKTFESNINKANLFGEILSNSFKNEYQIDSMIEQEIENTNRTFFEKEIISSFDFKEISMDELSEVLKKLNAKTSAGEDGIHNMMLKNCPPCFRELLLKLINQSIGTKLLSDEWKIACVTMIPKKDGYSKDPTCYRPISLTSCLGKLVERMVANRLVSFLEENNLLIKEQSGFRRHRGTNDNLLFLTQKVSECLKRGKKCISIFFDIAKAFDRVWHDGILNKMIKMKIPSYLIFWVKSFLSNRKFKVKVDDAKSNIFEISAGVPQGAVISPILFSIFINDIPTNNYKNHSYSMLYADDLASFFCYDKSGHIKSIINKYLRTIEAWLVKWKLRMSANKCCYTIFTNGRRNERFDFKMFEENIPYEKNPTFLGIKFDEGMNFGTNIENIREKCANRLNIIKIISHKSWRLDIKTLLATYYALVRSVIDNMAFGVNRISDSNIKRLQVVQNKAVDSILKPGLRVNLIKLASSNGIQTVGERLKELFTEYYKTKSSHNNPLLGQLIEEYRSGFESRQEINQERTPLCLVKNQIFK